MYKDRSFGFLAQLQCRPETWAWLLFHTALAAQLLACTRASMAHTRAHGTRLQAWRMRFQA